MNDTPGWIERLRTLQLASFEQDWESNLQRLNSKPGLNSYQILDGGTGRAATT